MTKEYHKLYSFRRCPYAMRARMALAMARIPHIITEVDFKNKPAEMLRLSPKGTVPVLVLSDGTVIDESIDIVRFAMPDQWAGADHDLFAANDGWFKSALDRYKYPTRFEGEDCSNARSNGEKFIRELDVIVTIGEITVNDICIFPFVRQFANVDREWFDSLPYENTKSWLDHCVNSDLFQLIFDKKYAGFTGSKGWMTRVV